VFLSALVTQATKESGMVLSIPAMPLVAFTLVAIIAGVGAAIMPARRASRLNVLDALQYE
jgi:putative ABC transport system permease protein